MFKDVRCSTAKDFPFEFTWIIAASTYSIYNLRKHKHEFCEGYRSFQCKDTILIVVDRLTIYGHIVGLKHPFTADYVTKDFMKEVVNIRQG